MIYQDLFNINIHINIHIHHPCPNFMSGQPLHPDFIDKLDPEYVEFHNNHLAQIAQGHLIPWDSVSRNFAGPIPGCSPPLDVGTTKDLSLSNCKVRVFTPKGSSPSDGWPVFVFYHGGGWTYGNIDTENSFSSHMCIGMSLPIISTFKTHKDIKGQVV